MLILIVYRLDKYMNDDLNHPRSASILAMSSFSYLDFCVCFWTVGALTFTFFYAAIFFFLSELISAMRSSNIFFVKNKKYIYFLVL